MIKKWLKQNLGQSIPIVKNNSLTFHLVNQPPFRPFLASQYEITKQFITLFHWQKESLIASIAESSDEENVRSEESRGRGRGRGRRRGVRGGIRGVKGTRGPGRGRSRGGRGQGPNRDTIALAAINRRTDVLQVSTLLKNKSWLS